MSTVPEYGTIPAALSGYSPEKVLAKLGTAPVVSGEPFFDLWLSVVDRLVSSRLGLGIHDLEDQPYNEMFEDGLRPREVALMIVEDAVGGWE